MPVDDFIGSSVLTAEELLKIPTVSDVIPEPFNITVGSILSKVFGGGDREAVRAVRRAATAAGTANKKTAFDRARVDTALSAGVPLGMTQNIVSYQQHDQTYQQPHTIIPTKGNPEGAWDIDFRTPQELVSNLGAVAIDSGQEFGAGGMFLSSRDTIKSGAEIIYKELLISNPEKAQSFKSIAEVSRDTYNNDFNFIDFSGVQAATKTQITKSSVLTPTPSVQLPVQKALPPIKITVNLPPQSTLGQPTLKQTPKLPAPPSTKASWWQRFITAGRIASGVKQAIEFPFFVSSLFKSQDGQAQTAFFATNGSGGQGEPESLFFDFGQEQPINGNLPFILPPEDELSQFTIEELEKLETQPIGAGGLLANKNIWLALLLGVLVAYVATRKRRT